MKNASKIVSDYYSEKIRQHGTSPEGVDWNGRESQFLRFEQLSRLLPEGDGSLADIGCGYGAYVDYLSATGRGDLSYSGYDLSPEMIKEAVKTYPLHSGKFKVIDAIADIPKTDYAIASGIYNVRQHLADDEWNVYIKDSLRQIYSIANKGFSFNILTSYSDIDKRREYLYYASPEEFFGFCKKNFSKDVALLHDYGLYEFTIIVRK